MEILLDKDAGAAPVKDGDTESFMADVVEGSQEQPVIVDFWAGWCGPCKQLTPVLERVVRAAKGAVRLVKIDADRNPELSAQLRVQSLPTVIAFHKGRPVDAFQGARPESQVKSWVDQLVRRHGGKTGSPVDAALAAATAAMQTGDHGTAQTLFGQVLAREAHNPKALAGLARSCLQSGEAAKADSVLADLPEETAAQPEIAAVRAAVALALAGRATAGQAAELEARVASAPADLAAHHELARTRFGSGQVALAIDSLLDMIRIDRNWNDQAARTDLLTILDSLGPTHPASVEARRRLSALLFS